MADYLEITEAQSNPFAPLTSELVKQLRDNPLAIAEGTAGAPIIQSGWGPWNGGNYGTGDALIYDHAVDGNVTSVETPDLSADYEYKLVWKNLSRAGDQGVTLLFDLFLTSTSAYTISGLDLGLLGAALSQRVNTGFANIPRLTGDDTHFIIKAISNFENPTVNSGNFLSIEQETIRDVYKVIKRTTATRVGKVRLRADVTDGIRQGKIYLFRRLVEGL